MRMVCACAGTRPDLDEFRARSTREAIRQPLTMWRLEVELYGRALFLLRRHAENTVVDGQRAANREEPGDARGVLTALRGGAPLAKIALLTRSIFIVCALAFLECLPFHLRERRRRLDGLDPRPALPRRIRNCFPAGGTQGCFRAAGATATAAGKDPFLPGGRPRRFSGPCRA